MLALYEKFFLLALNEEKGNLIWFTRKPFAYTIYGLILAELVLLGKLDIAEKLRLVTRDAQPTGDPILDGVLDQIRSSEKAHKPAYWIDQLSVEPKKLRQSIGEQLVGKNILTQDDKRFFRKESAPGSEPAPDRFQIKYELRASILSNAELNSRDMTLLKMIAASDLLGLIFTEDEVDAAERTIHKQVLNSALGDQKMQLVEEVGQAVTSILEEEME